MGVRELVSQGQETTIKTVPEQILSHLTNSDINYSSDSRSNKNC